MAGIKRQHSKIVEDSSDEEVIVRKRTENTKTFHVPADMLTDVTPTLASQLGNRPLHLLNHDITSLYPTLHDNVINHNKSYYRIKHAIMFIVGGYNPIRCSFPGCGQKGRIVDTEFQTVRLYMAKDETRYDWKLEEHPVLLECSCRHEGWIREMDWVKRPPVQFLSEVREKIVTRWINSDDDSGSEEAAEPSNTYEFKVKDPGM